MAKKGYVDNTGRNISFYDENLRPGGNGFQATPNVSASANTRKTLFQRLKDQQQDTALASSSLSFLNDTEETNKNRILGVDSFLQFPTDLGVDKRYRQFMVFNIYKSTSDKMDNELRATKIYSAGDSPIPGGIEGKKKSELASIGSSEAFAFQEASLVAAQNNQTTAQWIQENPDRYNAMREQSRIAYENVGLSPTNVAANQQTLRRIKQSEEGFDWFGYASEDDSVSLSSDKQSLWNAVPAVSQAKQYYEAIWGGQFGPDPENPRDPPPKNLGQINSRGKKVQVDNATTNNNRRFLAANIRSKDTIALYMTQNHSVADAFAYAEKDMAAMSLIANGSLGTALIEGQGNVADSVARQLTTDVPGLDFAGGVDFATIRDALRGGVKNARKELMFGEPQMRQFSFTYDFYPRSLEEANRVADIIQMFRYHAYPRLQTDGGHFFMFPAEFEIEFYIVSDDPATGEQRVQINGYLPKIARCALTNIQVAYSPNGIWSTFPDGSPVGTQLSLTFSEVQALNQDNIINGY
jgi:hypothetical protein